MDVPLTLRDPPWPFASRPEPPADGERVQILWYTVERKTCTSCNPPKSYYYVRNFEGTVLSMADAPDGWAAMCHYLCWFAVEGTELGKRLPSTAAPAPSKQPTPPLNAVAQAQAPAPRERAPAKPTPKVEPPRPSTTQTSMFDTNPEGSS